MAKYYEDFNKSVKDKYLRITLISDSTLNVLGGTKIIDDSLKYSYQINKVIKIEPNEIKDIKYLSDNMSHFTATVLL